MTLTLKIASKFFFFFRVALYLMIMPYKVWLKTVEQFGRYRPNKIENTDRWTDGETDTVIPTPRPPLPPPSPRGGGSITSNVLPRRNPSFTKRRCHLSSFLPQETIFLKREREREGGWLLSSFRLSKTNTTTKLLVDAVTDAGW